MTSSGSAGESDTPPAQVSDQNQEEPSAPVQSGQTTESGEHQGDRQDSSEPSGEPDPKASDAGEVAGGAGEGSQATGHPGNAG